MINGPSVYDSGALGKVWPDLKPFLSRIIYSRRRSDFAEGTRIIYRGTIYHF